MVKINIRETTVDDAPKVLEFINKIAAYENMSADVTNTVEMIKAEVYEKHTAKVKFIEIDGEAVGFALYFYNYSTFNGKKGLYLEDFFVNHDKRGLGLGKALFNNLVETAKAEGCGRMEWCCLKWNQPSIDFYTNAGASPMSEWDTWRITF